MEEPPVVKVARGNTLHFSSSFLSALPEGKGRDWENEEPLTVEEDQV